jgi:hypothetical protein
MRHNGYSWLADGLRRTFLLCGMICLSIILRVDTCSAAPSGLVAWWKGEGNAEDSAGANNPSVISGIGYNDGEVGRAFQFDGRTSLITVPRSPSLTMSNLTVEAWIFPTDDTAPRPILDCGGPGQASSIQLWVNTTGGFSVNLGGLHAVIRDAIGGYEVDTPSPVAPKNQWSHVAFTADAGTRTLRLYCNGIPVATSIAPNPLHQELFSNVNIGYRDAASSELLAGRHFSGALDEVGIHNRVLSDAEIRAIYSAGRHGRLNAVKTDPQVNSLAVVNPYPILSISKSGANVLLSWPIWAADFKLQSANLLAPRVEWSNVAVTPQTNGDNVMVSLPVPSEPQFFRLAQP